MCFYIIIENNSIVRQQMCQKGGKQISLQDLEPSEPPAHIYA